MREPYLITTAIAYPNGRPHIGHAYEAIAGDAIARFRRSQGRDVRFVGGTDEHGLKMVQTARAEGRETLEFADEMSSYFRQMCDKLNIVYDDFVRTSEPRHHEASIALWNAIKAAGDLYLDRYEGWYSVRDEAFYDESELVAGESGDKLSPQGTPVEWTAEETWFFRLSKYQDRLLRLYSEQPDFIQPESRRNEVMRFVEGGLKDLSVSRTSFDWGVPVPGSPGHVMYVWVDALTTYMTGVGFPDQSGDWARYWPADVHLIGKDIVRFHTVYWPAFLMSADLPLPKQVFGHGFLLSRGEKMSKSIGNVVDPIALADRFGVDALRYFLLREVPFGQDGSYSAEAIVNRVNAELANSFGNLAQRTLSMIYKNLDGILPAVGMAPEDVALLKNVDQACTEAADRFDVFAFSVGLEAWMAAVFACNAYVDSQAPWALRKTDSERMAAVLGTLVAAVRRLTVAIAPIIPQSADRLLTLIDSHCHLNYEGLAERRDEVLDNARNRGVAGFLNISTRQREWDDVVAVAEANDDVWATIGVHPHEADAHPDLGAAALIEGARHPRVIAIGECGLDYYYDKSDRQAQRERFQAHIDAARETGLPLVVHTREAEDDTAEILTRAVKEGGVTGVLHCFTGSAELARKALDLGFYISLSGIVTFKNAADLQETARQVPSDRLLVETDAPFLAPVPNRGKTCEPAFVADTAAFAADLRGEPLELLAKATTANFFTLFNKAAA